MRFTKMQGAGNDYIYLDLFRDPATREWPELARRISDRHFGVGADGLVLIGPSTAADARMRMFNADGSEAEMCGNAIRCVARYLYDEGHCRQERIAIETASGILTLDLQFDEGQVHSVRVDMGRPRLAAAEIPTTLAGDPVIEQPLAIAGQEFRATCVSMGNPHCVLFVEQITDALVHGVGPKIEHDPRFPRRVNVEFVEVLSPDEVRMRVWERGSGETMACGTGAAAVCVAGVLAGRTARRVLVHLLGGELQLEWADNDHVYKTGPAEYVFHGDWPDGSPARGEA